MVTVGYIAAVLTGAAVLLGLIRASNTGDWGFAILWMIAFLASVAVIYLGRRRR